MNILIIEDHYYFVRMLLEKLAPQHTTGESDFINITTTSDGKVGLKLLKNYWNWILIDHDLPYQCAGWKLLNTSKKYREIDNAKIIAISAVPENNKKLMQYGAHFQVEKMDKTFATNVLNIIHTTNGLSKKS